MKIPPVRTKGIADEEDNLLEWVAFFNRGKWGRTIFR